MEDDDVGACTEGDSSNSDNRVVNPAVMERFSNQFSHIRFVQRHLFRISRC